jgi:hypothetical protein
MIVQYAFPSHLFIQRVRWVDFSFIEELQGRSTSLDRAPSGRTAISILIPFIGEKRMELDIIDPLT